MTRLTVLFTALAVLIVLPGCKKKPPEEPATTVAPPPPAPLPPEPVQEMAKNFSLVYFAFDSAALSGSSKSALDANVTIMSSNDDIKVEIQGHADERGTTDYNMALGQRRANAVYQYLTSGGVSTSRLKVVSYGEERPRDGGHSESSWSENRRAEFVITWKGDANVKGTNE